MDKTKHHRTGRGNPSVRLDPYALDDTTITLAEWRRTTTPRPATPARRPRRATKVTRSAAALHRAAS